MKIVVITIHNHKIKDIANGMDWTHDDGEKMVVITLYVMVHYK